MVSEPANPWLVGPVLSAPSDEPITPTPLPTAYSGPRYPQRGVPVINTADRLPRRTVERHAPVWWVGAHGGSGETTLAQLNPVMGHGQHAWPLSNDATTRVILVARSTANGLLAAQRSATEWASGSLPTVKLIGLAVIADTPSRLPKPLRELAARVGGAVPRVWNLPWVEPWRLGEPVSLETAPKDFRSLLVEVSAELSNHPER